MDDNYWDDLSKWPPMKKKEELEVARKAKNGNRKAYEKLIKSNLRYVVRVAKQYTGRGLELDDLIGYGNLGLCKAFKKFDPDCGYKFITYSNWWIKQQILKALNTETEMIKIPPSNKANFAKIRKIEEELSQELQRQPTFTEVIDHIENTIDIGDEERKRIISIEESFTKSGNAPIKNIIENENAFSPHNRIKNEEFIQVFEELLDEFTDREKDIIKDYYGIDFIRDKTLEEIGIKWEITRERVRQIKEKVLKKLRHPKRMKKIKPYLRGLKPKLVNDLRNSEQDTI